MTSKATALQNTEPEYSQKIGLIDAGSGTIRLVIYGVTDTGGITKLFTDKANCQLGESLASNHGKLSQEAQTCAIDSIKRFKEAAREHGADCLHAFGTAAFREAKNKKLFLSDIEAKTGIEIDVITGKEESRLQAIGSSLGNKHTKGRISADLGRTSLDVAIIKTIPRKPKSVLLGSAAVLAKADKADKYIGRELKKLPDYPKGRKMHLVGGSWRRMAKAYLRAQGIEEPRDVIHGYQVDVDDFMNFLDVLENATDQNLQDIHHLEEARIQHLPAAIETLRQFSDRYKTSGFVFSMFGVREGYLLSKVLNKKAKDVTVLPPSELEPSELAAE